MKIAQVSPLYESVPPKLYGGTERIVSYLTDELVRLGHEVTLFASGDSTTLAELTPICARALRLDPEVRDGLAYHIVQMQQVHDRRNEFDIIHYHTDYFHFPLSRLNQTCQVTTLHGRLDLPELKHIYEVFSDMPVISISHAQRIPLPMANWVETIYHGIPLDLYAPSQKEGSYLAFLGRISPEKRLDRAIEIARRTGIPIKIAAKIDMVDREYFKSRIERLLDDSRTEYIGEISDSLKGEFLGNARALIFPIDWPEPFGMVMIEALANGVPVIAYEHGSVSELIDDGVTGFIVSSIEEAVDAVNKLDKIDRMVCRKIFEKRFSVKRMATDYVRIYERLVGTKASESK